MDHGLNVEQRPRCRDRRRNFELWMQGTAINFRCPYLKSQQITRKQLFDDNVVATALTRNRIVMGLPQKSIADHRKTCSEF